MAEGDPAGLVSLHRTNAALSLAFCNRFKFSFGSNSGKMPSNSETSDAAKPKLSMVHPSWMILLPMPGSTPVSANKSSS